MRTVLTSFRHARMVEPDRDLGWRQDRIFVNPHTIVRSQRLGFGFKTSYLAEDVVATEAFDYKSRCRDFRVSFKVSLSDSHTSPVPRLLS